MPIRARETAPAVNLQVVNLLFFYYKHEFYPFDDKLHYFYSSSLYVMVLQVGKIYAL